MMARALVATVVATCVAGWLTSMAGAQEEAAAPTDAKDQRPSDFARFVPVGDGGHFDTAITTYRNGDGVEVILFAAVHIADAACYEQLQARFEHCDALLYELVGPEDYRPRRGDDRPTSFVSLLQHALKSSLELEFQLDGIDYTAANFVHADMTPEEFHASMDERGESLFGMLLQVGLRAQLAQTAAAADDDDDAPKPASASEFDLVRAFRNGEGRHRMRVMMAQQLEGLEAAAAGGAGSTLLEGRNEKCLAVLQQQIAAGKRKLGIYYGGAHLPHMERRLCEDLGFHKVDHEWITAWDCTKRPDPRFDRELYEQRRRARDEIERLAAVALRWRESHDGRAPTPDELGAAAASDQKAAAPLDPWGHAYSIDGYAVPPFVDVSSRGQDGEVGTADDIHSASARDLRRMRRAAAATDAPRK